MKVAVLIPCFNEALTIAKVVADFKKELPKAQIYVYDNNSTDGTGSIAQKAGAIVRKETRQGKGFVVRQMFFDIDADYYVMVDGDDTYPAEAVHDLLKPLIDGEADMTVGDRLSNGTYFEENKRKFHGFGNNLVRDSINYLYKSHINDVMTGYRGFSRVFVKSASITSSGYQIETELTIHALDRHFRVVEVPIDYRDRPADSYSKLNTVSDGFKVIMMIVRMVKDSMPMMFFGVGSMIFFIFGLLSGVPVVLEFFKSGFIRKLPSAILATGMMMFALMLLITGFILDTIVKQDRRQYELYLIQVYEKEHQKEAGRGTYEKH